MGHSFTGEMEPTQVKASEDFPEIWHYTTVEGIRGIWNSRVLWATHCHDMNDRSELSRFRLLAESIATRHVSERSRRHHQEHSIAPDAALHSRIAAESKQLLDLFENTTFGPTGVGWPMISCFCSHKSEYDRSNGLLSQWRGYGGEGGVAIVFDTSLLEQQMYKEARTYFHPVNHIVDVLYDHENIFGDREVERFFNQFKKWLDAIIDETEPDHETMKELLPLFIQATTRVKHRAFHEEQEVRIVICPRPKDSSSIFFDSTLSHAPEKRLMYRRRGEDEVRYIELFQLDLGVDLVRKIVVGPSRFQNLNLQTVRELTKSTGIDVVPSDIPYIP